MNIIVQFSPRKGLGQKFNRMDFGMGWFGLKLSSCIDKIPVMTLTDSGFTAVTGASQYLIMPKHMSKELAEPMNIDWKTSSIHRFENG